MTRSIADLGWDELDAIAREAGVTAAEETRAAGISTFGVIDGITYQVKPDGSLHDLGPIDALDDPFDVVRQAAESDKTRQRATRSGKRNGRTVEEHETRSSEQERVRTIL